MNDRFTGRVVFVSFAVVVAFAVVFVWMDAGRGWPDLPPHFAPDLDLAAGCAAAAAAAAAAIRVAIESFRRGRG